MTCIEGLNCAETKFSIKDFFSKCDQIRRTLLFSAVLALNYCGKTNQKGCLLLSLGLIWFQKCVPTNIWIGVTYII